MIPLRSFTFGKDFSPKWFLALIERGKVKYYPSEGRVLGCEYTDINGNKVVKFIGDMISNQDFFQTEEEQTEYCERSENRWL